MNLFSSIPLMLALLNVQFPITTRPPFTDSVTIATTVRTNILQWAYRDDWRPLVRFRVVGSSNLFRPLNNWDVLATLPGTATQYIHVVTGSQYFYAVSASLKP